MGISAAIDLWSRHRCFACRGPGPALCSRCAASLAPPEAGAAISGIDEVFIPWRYEGPARDLVLALKLRSQRAAAEGLVAALAASIQRRGTSASAITWVPARARDVRRRGFDHAAVIADRLGRSIGLPVIPTLQRTSARPDQTTLTGAARRANLVGAFRAPGAPGAVLLVDDLVTTGATASSCARAL